MIALMLRSLWIAAAAARGCLLNGGAMEGVGVRGTPEMRSAGRHRSQQGPAPATPRRETPRDSPLEVASLSRAFGTFTENRRGNYINAHRLVEGLHA
ncbi:hypothetical protein AAFF_G00125260 [Aldrovandia affinis]|uniref:Secreted protein n=1 Tax=Aldrovandia affinis TaxID=143900 RepID=A0AAD7WA14_9TELE|nr:hypothetical protein AAFF_G00125260 [Aldrovandia affinis]